MSELKELDRKYLWHPFTQMKEWMEDEPLVIERGEGNYLIDTDGRRYLDGVSSLWCNIHGHRKREIDDAIRKQLDKIAHSTMLGLANCPSIRLGERLVSISPHGLEKVFYSDSGSTSVEIALKMAFQYWQQKRKEKTESRNRFVYFTSSYHGDTIGSVSVGGIDLFHRLYSPLLFNSYKAYYPHCYRCPVDKDYPSCKITCIKQLNGILDRYHNNIAALIIEPLVQGAAGIITSPPGFLRKVRDLCTDYNILMIADEVATGFGRTGRMFACEHEEVSPDILCLAKGITGGYLPLAATLTTEEVFGAFLGEYRECKTLFHGHTYTGNPLACAAAIANLEVFEKGNILKILAPKITLFEGLLDRFKILPHVGEVRQKGFMAGIELVMDKGNKEPYPLEDKIGIKVCKEARRDGLIIRPLGNTIVLMPPLSIRDSELKDMTDIVHKAIVKITNE
ncbi:MAG: adenosylmethionine--8-amino-7-oxononanoate transaminase [Thermodesulfobacteriota bacterium]